MLITPTFGFRFLYLHILEFAAVINTITITLNLGRKVSNEIQGKKDLLQNEITQQSSNGRSLIDIQSEKVDRLGIFLFNCFVSCSF